MARLNINGKTRKVICGAILWHLSMFPHGHIVSTSGSYRQIADQLLPALELRFSVPPTQMLLLDDACATGAAFTVTLIVAVEKQPEALYTVTV